jgi:hypothetical protein
MMRSTLMAIFITGLLSFIIVSIQVSLITEYPLANDNYNMENDSLLQGSWTVFSINTCCIIFFGNNEDYKEVHQYFWLVPITDSTHRGVYFDFQNQSAHGVIYEAGLDAKYRAPPEKEFHTNTELLKKGKIMCCIMSSCSDVVETIIIPSPSSNSLELSR